MSDYLHTYFIMGSQNCKKDPVETLRRAIRGGITAFQFREKGEGSLMGAEKVKLGHRLREVCHEHEIPFFVNDDIELAREWKADGVHIGQEDTEIEKVRDRFPALIIGLSVSTPEELEQSRYELADYLGVGPVFKTSSKQDAKDVIGIEGLRTIQNKAGLPVVAIGGIHEGNVQKVRETGAGVSVISAIASNEDPFSGVQRLL
ncbi:thiamine phosphate synthase [Salimicrobium album]|uniref:Thiamine-phosphate synthase n=1 Tax=Salimicrobium album TaxID=50717 RepID=A0A1H3BDR8_9BACI|nr:thiamine phosphate synthase [Salimicrobium album]SDX40093.1 thiamine-phosphate diphosphorylase [Salimicrobium album]